MAYTKKQHQEVASQMERDSSGHFIKKTEDTVKETLSGLEKNVDYNKNQDDLLNVHIGNPLARITKLLEEIKEQKAFAFTLKGSLGLAGVAVALSVFGFFGGSKILCDKGVQTETGVIRVLNAKEAESSNVPVLGFIIDGLKGTFGTQTIKNRIVLQTRKDDIVNLPYSSKVNISPYNNEAVFITGQYDSCSKTLKADFIEFSE